MNLGLDPVQNSSRSGLKPDYDDLGSETEIESKVIQAVLGGPMKSWEVLGSPRRSRNLLAEVAGRSRSLGSCRHSNIYIYI